MEHLTLPSVVSPNFQKKSQKKKEKIAKNWESCRLRARTAADWRPVVARWPRRGPPFLCITTFFQTPASLLGHMWSILSHWL
jgi:hypothetical protein